MIDSSTGKWSELPHVVESGRGARGRVAVTGAGGTIGGQVVRSLASEDELEIVALTRRPTSSKVETVQHVIAPYESTVALEAALEGVDTLVFVSSDGPAAELLVHHYNVISAARSCGVRHIVALSGLDADVCSPFCYGVSYGLTERLLHDSGCLVSVVRTSIFTEFFLEFLMPSKEQGEIRVPASDAKISLVSKVDVALALAQIALQGGSGGTYELTGPEPLDLAGIALAAQAQWDVPVHYVPISPTEYRHQVAASGMELWWQYAFSTMFESICQHRWAKVTSDLEFIIGRPATSFVDVLTRMAISGRDESS